MEFRQYIEMRWRCAQCAAANLGRHGDCQSCGKRREGEPYYDEPGAPMLTAEEVAANAALATEAQAGPDWRCTKCGTLQERYSRACSQCGASQEEAADIRYGDPIELPVNIPLPSAYGLPTPRRGAPKLAIGLAVGAGVVVLALVMVLLLR